MSRSEFDIIQYFFTEQSINRADVELGIGDDAALLIPPQDMSLAVSADTLVSGIHFPLDTSPQAIGHKALAVNLSDMAAMGAKPAWCMLSITLPEYDEAWLTGFAQGFFDLAQKHNVQLVGGDTTRGPLTISIQITGFVPKGRALMRRGAQPGDGIYMTGTLGDAGLGLQLKQEKIVTTLIPSTTQATLVARLEYPTPRVEAGLALCGLATSAIDISDGLVADLGHILTASDMGADIIIEHIPFSAAYRALSPELSWQQAVNAGDDYELCFTAPADQEMEVQAKLYAIDCPCIRIGEISDQPGLRWHNLLQGEKGTEVSLSNTSFDHFAGEGH